MRHKVTTNLRYPQLWRKCIGAWAPLLGPSGTTLRDSSAFGNHGTLTGMDPATDWVISSGNYALDFDGVDDYVTAPNNGLCTEMSVSLWVVPRATSTFRGFFSSSNTTIGTSGMWLAGVGSTASRFRFTVNDGSAKHIQDTSNFTTGSLYHFCGVYTGSAIVLYINGVYIGETATSAIPINTQTTVQIGCRAAGNNHADAIINDIRQYRAILTESDIRLLAKRPGISYETQRVRRYFISGIQPDITLDCDSGSYTVTGTDCTLQLTRTLSCDSGTFTITGTACTLTATRTLSSDSGSYSITGTDCGLTTSRTLACDTVSYNITGTDCAFNRTYVSACDSGSYVINGTDANLQTGSNYDLACDSGSYTITGTDATFQTGIVLTCDTTAFNITGTDTAFLYSRSITCVTGQYLVTGTNAEFSQSGSDITVNRISLLGTSRERINLLGTST